MAIRGDRAIEEASTLPPFAAGPPLALAREAANLADVLPHLVLEARHIAAQLQLGIHGRRRAGPGEEFWEFRPFVAGESTSRIDWRRSAREDRLYVREREWESASVHWLWIDGSASMDFASRLAGRPKRDRAVVIGLALADMLVHAGERVGMPGETPPLAARTIIMRLAETMARRKPGAFDPLTGDALPERLPIRRQDHLVMIGDFIMPTADFEEKLARIAHRGVKGTVVLIRDPAEETFPFAGELAFESPETGEIWRVGEARDIAARYRARIEAINAELRRIALKNGFAFIKHRTDRPAVETLLTLAALLGGNAA
jgi:uncharacterized protein (DUF58 family)